MAYQIFLSHSSSDGDIVDQIKRTLKKRGIKVYDFSENTNLGKSINKKIGKAIENSNAVVVLITEEGQTSSWVNAEIGYAKAKDKQIIPIVEKGIENPDLPFIRGSEYMKFDRNSIEKTLLPELEFDVVQKRKKNRIGLTIGIGSILLLFIINKLQDDEN